MDGWTIKDLPADDRPREKLVRHGAGALSNAELLAILLGHGGRGETAVDLGRRILDGAGLRRLAAMTVTDLTRVRGVGLAKAAQIKAAVELGRRLAAAAGGPEVVIRAPGDVARLLMEDMRYLDREHFRTVLLNTKNHVLGVETVSVGSLASSIAHPREIFKGAIRASAAALILVHNHPSGDPTPSREDIEVTRRLREAGRLLGIEVLDHVIIGDNRYTSFREKGIE